MKSKILSNNKFVWEQEGSLGAVAPVSPPSYVPVVSATGLVGLNRRRPTRPLHGAGHTADVGCMLA